jgi:hypothetical protein
MDTCALIVTRPEWSRAYALLAADPRLEPLLGNGPDDAEPDE